MQFRDYHQGDFSELNHLWGELGMGGEERGDTEEIILRTLEMGGKLIIMEDDAGRIIGSSWMTFDGRRLFLHHFGIKKTYQRKGLGTKLAIKSLEYIRSKGYQVKLEVHKNNLIAKKLYEKAGFFAFTDYDIYMIRKPGQINLKEHE